MPEPNRLLAMIGVLLVGTAAYALTAAAAVPFAPLPAARDESLAVIPQPPLCDVPTSASTLLMAPPVVEHAVLSENAPLPQNNAPLPQSIEPQPIQSSGVPAQFIQPQFNPRPTLPFQGNQSQGTVPQGMQSQGMQSQGMPSQGTSPEPAMQPQAGAPTQTPAATQITVPPDFNRHRITIGQPTLQPLRSGELNVAPNVGVLGAPLPSGYDAEDAARASYTRNSQVSASWISNTTQPPMPAAAVGPSISPLPTLLPDGSSVLPPPAQFGEQIPAPQSFDDLDPAQMTGTFEGFEQPVLTRFGAAIVSHLRSKPLLRPTRPSQYDQGLGTERVAMAPNVIDITQPMNNFRIREVSYFDVRHPDRVEYTWARPSSIGGRGPQFVEPTIDYQELRFQMEVGAPRFSLATDVPLRWVDPVLNVNTGGLGDVTTTAKTVLIQGVDWQITQITRTYIPTGNAGKGLGTGHTSLEPGVLARYRWSPWTYFHHELKYWFALGGHPDHSGRQLRYGTGVSRVFYETDDFAILPTLEMIMDYASDGQVTNFPSTVPVGVMHTPLFQLCPGTRFSWDTGGDAGLFELSFNGGVALTREYLYGGMFRTDIRWIF